VLCYPAVPVKTDQILHMKSMVSRNHFLLSYQDVENFVGSYYSAMLTCSFRDKCSTFCETGPNAYLLANNVYVSGGIVDSDPTDHIPCYTTNPRVIYPSEGSTITATATNVAVAPSRVIENLMDGVYDGFMGTCYLARPLPKKFVMVEFPNAVKIWKVVIRTQPFHITANMFKNTELRIGTLPSLEDDFSDFVLFGTYQTADPGNDVDIVFESNSPVVGKYVVLVVKEGNMQLCFIEVY